MNKAIQDVHTLSENEEYLQGWFPNIGTLINNFKIYVSNKYLRFNNLYQKFDSVLGSKDTKAFY